MGSKYSDSVNKCIGILYNGIGRLMNCVDNDAGIGLETRLKVDRCIALMSINIVKLCLEGNIDNIDYVEMLKANARCMEYVELIENMQISKVKETADKNKGFSVEDFENVEVLIKDSQYADLRDIKRLGELLRYELRSALNKDSSILKQTDKVKLGIEKPASKIPIELVLQYGREGLSSQGIAKKLASENNIICNYHSVLDAQKRYVKNMVMGGSDIETIVATTGVKQRLVENWTRL